MVEDETVRGITLIALAFGFPIFLGIIWWWILKVFDPHHTWKRRKRSLWSRLQEQEQQRRKEGQE